MVHKNEQLSFHQKCAIKHTEKRAKERYDIWIPTDVFLIAKEIKKFHDANKGGQHIVCCGVNNNVTLLYREKRNSDKYHYLIEWRNKYYWAVWAENLDTINTFLPLDGLKFRIGFMTNSVAGLLSSKNLIELEKYNLLDISKVHHKPNRTDILNNDSYWQEHSIDEDGSEAFSHNDLSIPHHSIHSQPEQLLDDHREPLLHMTKVHQNPRTIL